MTLTTGYKNLIVNTIASLMSGNTMIWLTSSDEIVASTMLPDTIFNLAVGGEASLVSAFNIPAIAAGVATKFRVFDLVTPTAYFEGTISTDPLVVPDLLVADATMEIGKFATIFDWKLRYQ